MNKYLNKILDQKVEDLISCKIGFFSKDIEPGTTLQELCNMEITPSVLHYRRLIREKGVRIPKQGFIDVALNFEHIQKLFRGLKDYKKVLESDSRLVEYSGMMNNKRIRRFRVC